MRSSEVSWGWSRMYLTGDSCSRKTTRCVVGGWTGSRRRGRLNCRLLRTAARHRRQYFQHFIIPQGLQRGCRQAVAFKQVIDIELALQINHLARQKSLAFGFAGIFIDGQKG